LPPALDAVRLAVSTDPFWAERLSGLTGPTAIEFSVHLAVFVEPFLGYILDGSKTVESRFWSTDAPRSGESVKVTRCL